MSRWKTRNSRGMKSMFEALPLPWAAQMQRLPRTMLWSLLCSVMVFQETRPDLGDKFCCKAHVKRLCRKGCCMRSQDENSSAQRMCMVWEQERNWKVKGEKEQQTIRSKVRNWDLIWGSEIDVEQQPMQPFTILVANGEAALKWEVLYSQSRRLIPALLTTVLLREALLQPLRCLRWREQMAQLSTGSPGGHFLMPPVMPFSGSATASPWRYTASRMHTECDTVFEPGQSRQSPDWTTSLMSTDMYYVIRKKGLGL